MDGMYDADDVVAAVMPLRNVCTQTMNCFIKKLFFQDYHVHVPSFFYTKYNIFSPPTGFIIIINIIVQNLYF